jgi:hypothetical protein
VPWRPGAASTGPYGPGRLSILGVPHSLEWVTPVLYLRGDASRLFDLRPPDIPPYQEDADYQAGQAAVSRQRWREAVTRLTAAAARYPDEPAVALLWRRRGRQPTAGGGAALRGCCVGLSSWFRPC